jgi:subtilisin-like proprotein convertase family protein
MSDAMKISIQKSLVVAFTVIFAACLAQGQVFSTNVSTTVNTAIPDGNPVGLTSTANISTLPGTITSVTVTLDITGGFNGDLYAYLAGPVGGFSVLLNRTGISATTGNSLGYSNPGFNVTFSTGSPNIHLYQLNTPSFDPVTGQLTGTWAPDGRNIDPQSSPSAFDSASTSADLSTFVGNSANGNWTLFVADMSSGGQSTLVNWGMTVVTTPEPQTWVLVAGGIGLLFVFNRGRKL